MKGRQGKRKGSVFEDAFEEQKFGGEALCLRQVLCFFFLLSLASGSCLSLPPAAQQLVFLYGAAGCTGLLAGECWKKRRVTREFLLELSMAAGCFLYKMLLARGGCFYRGICGLSAGISRGAGALFGRALSMGPGYSGADLAVLFVMLLLCTGLLYGAAFRRGFCTGALLLPAVWMLYLLLWSCLAEASLTLGLNGIEPLTGALDYRLLFLAMLCALFALAADGIAVRRCTPFSPVRTRKKPSDKDAAEEKHRRLTEKAPADTGKSFDAAGAAAKEKKRSFLFLPAALLCLGLAAAYGRLPGLSEKNAEPPVGRIVFLNTGIDFSVPERGCYGLERTGMFGMLPLYLSDRGYECVLSDKADRETLAGCAVLVIFNPMRFLSEEELASIRNFVREGGTVLAAGDHTGGESIRLPLNELLLPAGISLNFDSAIPFHALWADGLTKSRNSLLKGVGREQLQIVVGASLSLKAPAEALVTGKNAYSDAGDPENIADGALGNMYFERGEAVGDLVLAAESRFGKGRFIVFGDTTPFQNTILAYSYPLIDRLFLESGGKRDATGAKEMGKAFPFSCVIDAGHLEGFSRDKSGNALDGLIAAVMRTGGMAYMNRSASLTDLIHAASERSVRLIVLTEPALPLSEGELAGLAEFMERGGRLILCADYESPEASRSIAERFGFSFEALPLGRVAPDDAPEMAFWNACPLLFEENAAETRMALWGYPVIAWRRFGKGGLYMFADADFFKNKNLENTDSYRMGNVAFTEALLAELVKDVP